MSNCYNRVPLPLTIVIKMELYIFCLLILTISSPVLCVKVAVYEHVVKSALHPGLLVTRTEALRLMMKNLDVYKTQSEAAAKQGAKLVVFPERGIYGFGQTRDSIVPYLEDIPDVVDWNPCVDPDRFPDTDVQHTLSCIARNSSLYIVANFGDIKRCNKSESPSCPNDKRYQFNTNLVYDSQGKFVSLYHKRHLWFEADVFNQALFPEIAILETPFGRFGMVISADIYFHTPTENLFTEFGIQNLLVSSAWSVDYTYQASLQAFSGLAKRHNATVIAANIRNKANKMAGSGIFSAPNSLEVFSDLDYNRTEGKLLVADVQSCTIKPPYSKRSIIKEQKKDRTKDTNRFPQNVQQITTVTPNVRFNGSWIYLWLNQGPAYISYGSVTCNLDYKFSFRSSDELFGMFATEDVINGTSILHRQICGVVKCRTMDPVTCGQDTTSVKSRLGYIKIAMTQQAELVFPHVTTLINENETAVDVELARYTFQGQSRRYVLESSNGFTNPFLAAILFGNNVLD